MNEFFEQTVYIFSASAICTILLAILTIVATLRNHIATTGARILITSNAIALTLGLFASLLGMTVSGVTSTHCETEPFYQDSSIIGECYLQIYAGSFGWATEPINATITLSLALFAVSCVFSIMFTLYNKNTNGNIE